MAEFVPEFLPGRTAEHFVGGVCVTGAAREMAARFTGRGGEEAAPVTVGEEEQQTASPEWPAVPNRESDGGVPAGGVGEVEEIGLGNGMTCRPGAD